MSVFNKIIFSKLEVKEITRNVSKWFHIEKIKKIVYFLLIMKLQACKLSKSHFANAIINGEHTKEMYVR